MRKIPWGVAAASLICIGSHASTIHQFPNPHAAELRQLLDGHLNVDDTDTLATARLLHQTLRGESDLAILFEKVVRVIEDPDRLMILRERVEQALRLYVNPELGETIRPEQLRNLEHDAARLLDHYKDNEPMQRYVAVRMTQFGLWTERSLDYALDRVDDVDVVSNFQMYSAVLHASGPAARAELVEFLRRSRAAPKFKLALLFEANALEDEDYGDIFDIAVVEWSAVIAYRTPDLDDRAAWDDQLFEQILHLVQQRLARFDPAMLRHVRAAEARLDSREARLFFATLSRADFSWARRDNWRSLGLEAHRATRPASRSLKPSHLRLVDPKWCGTALTDE